MPTERHTMTVIRYQVISITLSSNSKSTFQTFSHTGIADDFGILLLPPCCHDLKRRHLSDQDIVRRYHFLTLEEDGCITSLLVELQHRSVGEVLSEASLMVEKQGITLFGNYRLNATVDYVILSDALCLVAHAPLRVEGESKPDSLVRHLEGLAYSFAYLRAYVYCSFHILTIL